MVLVCFGAGDGGWVRLARCPHGVALAATSAGWTLLVPSTVPPLCHVDGCTNGCDPITPASWPLPARSVACGLRPDSAMTLAVATNVAIVGRTMATASRSLRHLAAATDAPGTPLSSPVVLVIAAVVAVTILAVVAVVGSRCDRRPCRKPQPDVVVAVGSPTAPVSWFHLYQNDTGLPHSILTDDDCTTMILRSSRPSPKDHMVPGSYPPPHALDEQSISGVSADRASVHGWQTPDGSSNSYATVDASYLSLSHALDDEYDYDARTSRLSER